MRQLRRVEPERRRAWWRLWPQCRCGHACRPAAPGSPVELTEAERAEIRALAGDVPPVPPLPRMPNQRATWNAPARPYLINERRGRLTPGSDQRPRPNYPG